jgi:hypothetical protein
LYGLANIFNDKPGGILGGRLVDTPKVRASKAQYPYANEHQYGGKYKRSNEQFDDSKSGRRFTLLVAVLWYAYHWYNL